MDWVKQRVAALSLIKINKRSNKVESLTQTRQYANNAIQNLVVHMSCNEKLSISQMSMLTSIRFSDLKLISGGYKKADLDEISQILKLYMHLNRFKERRENTKFFDYLSSNFSYINLTKGAEQCRSIL